MGRDATGSNKMEEFINHQIACSGLIFRGAIFVVVVGVIVVASFHLFVTLIGRFILNLTNIIDRR